MTTGLLPHVPLTVVRVLLVPFLAALLAGALFRATPARPALTEPSLEHAPETEGEALALAEREQAPAEGPRLLGRGSPGSGGAGRAPQECVREYLLPRLEESWAWWVTGLPSQVHALRVTPDTVQSVIWGLVLEELGGVGAAQTQVALEGRHVLRVNAPRAIHRELARILERSVWTPTNGYSAAVQPEWPGLPIAAAEIADMLLLGTSEERTWGDSAMRAASEELRGATEEVLARLKAKTAKDRAAIAEDLAELPAPRVRVDVRLFQIDSNALRDLGVDVRRVSNGLGRGGLGGGPASQRTGVRSEGPLLDDTQVMVLEKCADKGWSARDGVPAIRRIDSRILWPAKWQRESVMLGDCCLLGMEAVASANRKDVCLRLGLRTTETGKEHFVPLVTCALPNGGSLLLRPGDTLAPDRVATSRFLLLLTAEIDPPEPAADVDGAAEVGEPFPRDEEPSAADAASSETPQPTPPSAP